MIEEKFLKLDLNFIPSNSAPILLFQVPYSGLMNTLVLYQSLIDLTADKSPSLSLEASSKPPVDPVVNVSWQNSSSTDHKAKWTGQHSPAGRAIPPGCQRVLEASTEATRLSLQVCSKRPPRAPLHTLIQNWKKIQYPSARKPRATSPQVCLSEVLPLTCLDSQVCCAIQLQPGHHWGQLPCWKFYHSHCALP